MAKSDNAATAALRAPLRNTEIADRIDDIATMLELSGANTFRVRAYRNASRLLRRYGREMTDLLATGADLAELPGIGEDLAGKICDLVNTGTTAMLEQLKASTPPVALELMQIPGLGPKRIAVLIKKLRLQSVDQLRRAALKGRIRKLAGFGEKSQHDLIDRLEAHKVKGTHVMLSSAASTAKSLTSYLENAPGISRVVIAGSFRRGQETVGDLDILCVAKRGADAIARFKAYPEFAKIEAAGATRATAFLRSGLQVDLRVVAAESFGAALYYFTGSKAHNIAVRAIAQKRGLKINEYGVYRGRRRIGGKTEEEVFTAVNLPYIEPELRENRGEIEAARSGKLPKLLTVRDIKGDLHVHSDRTDGKLSIRDMALAAKVRGLSYIAITDHAPHLETTHGLDRAGLRREIAEIDRLSATGLGIYIFKGVEVDILPDGTLGLPDSVLSKLDLVVAAVHNGFDLSREAQTARVEKALAHPCVTILAHPTGRRFVSQEAYNLDVGRIVRAAAANRVALEINAQPDRLDLPDIYCRMAKEAGALLSIASDAHAEQDYANLAYGVAQARRGWLETKDVLNTLTPAKLRDVLARRRQTHGASAAL